MAPRVPRLLAALVAALMLVLTCASIAAASSHQVSMMEDDRLLLDPGTRDRALTEMAALGTDYVHTQLVWSSVAPAKRPSGNLADPAKYDWSAWDALVAGAKAHGLKVLMTVTGPAPGWASGSGCARGTRRGACKPSVALFEDFVRAAGRHFAGRITTWSVYNEPNLDGWIAPLMARSHGHTYDFAARRYRDLYRAAIRGLYATGHRHDTILLGETSAMKGGRALSPGGFYRDVFCIDSRGRRLTGTTASVLGCRGFTRLPMSGLAQHPYTPAAACTPRCGGGGNDATIASLGHLATVLDQAARAGRISPGARNSIWITEFGFQGEPRGVVSPSKQATYLNWAEWIAFRNPRVRSFAQYELADDPTHLSFAVFNSTGLLYSDWSPKPSLAAWRLPIFVVPGGRGHVFVMAGVRRGGAQRVSIQARGPRGGFRTVTTVRTNGSGYAYVKLGSAGRRTWRLQWRGPDGVTYTSRTAGVL